MTDVKWIKIATDMFDNRKIRYLRNLPEGNSIVLIWVMLLCLAGVCNANGLIYLTEDVPYTPKMLADELKFDENTVVLALTALEQMHMISKQEDGIEIVGWAEHQNIDGMDRIREQNRLRKQRQRNRERLDVLPDSNMSRDGHGTVTERHAIEEERRNKKEEKEDSFNHSIAREESKRELLRGIGKGVVLLSDEQMDDLLDKLSLSEFEKYISIVAECELKGKSYTKKTHYQAIIDMAAKDRKINK